MWLVAGRWALLGYRDGRSGEHKVKGAEAFELRELATGDEFLVPGVAMIECAAATRHSHERTITGHFPLAADEDGLLLSPYANGAGALYEIDATTREVRWSLDALPGACLVSVALGPKHVAVVGAGDDGGYVAAAIDRGSGDVVWQRSVPSGDVEPMLALADDTLYLAWARTELSFMALELAAGRQLVHRERLGRTFAGAGTVIALVPRTRGVLLLATDRRRSTLVTAIDE